MNASDLLLKFDDQPFRPYRIKMVNNTTYDVIEPWMIMVGPTSAIVAARTQHDAGHPRMVLEWRTISIDHILELQDLDTPRQERRSA
jgi:hypothetical protein